jgi:hypothetical protein
MIFSERKFHKRFGPRSMICMPLACVGSGFKTKVGKEGLIRNRGVEQQSGQSVQSGSYSEHESITCPSFQSPKSCEQISLQCPDNNQRT